MKHWDEQELNRPQLAQRIRNTKVYVQREQHTDGGYLLNNWLISNLLFTLARTQTGQKALGDANYLQKKAIIKIATAQGGGAVRELIVVDWGCSRVSHSERSAIL